MTHKPPMHAMTNCGAHQIRPVSGSDIAIFGELVHFDGCDRIFAGTDGNGDPLFLWPSQDGRAIENAGRRMTTQRHFHSSTSKADQ